MNCYYHIQILLGVVKCRGLDHLLNRFIIRFLQVFWACSVCMLEQRRVRKVPIYLYNDLMVETRKVNDITQVCVAGLCMCGWAQTLTTKSVGWGRHCCCWVMGLRGEGANGCRVFTASVLTVLRLISLTVALVAGPDRVTGLDAGSVNNNLSSCHIG